MCIRDSGKNALICFTTWEGYNYEDAVLINEKLVRNDVYTCRLYTSRCVEETAASLTILMICDRVVSSPTCMARHFKNPDRWTVAAETLSPAALSKGMLSPVSADSSTALSPDVYKRQLIFFHNHQYRLSII